MDLILEKINADHFYQSGFQTAFGTTVADGESVLKALSQFMLQCVSANSRYDRYVRNEGGVLSAEELEGMSLFKSKCSTCHSSDLFTDNRFHNNGLQPTVIDDRGREKITLNNADAYLFKTPTLRNLAYSAPYMHDGRFRTIEEVLSHYSEGVRDGPTLDPALKKEGRPGIRFSREEQAKIIAFLHTLNDENFIRDEKLSEK